MYNEQNELTKLFLNMEKLLIDFRISQIDNSGVNTLTSSSIPSGLDLQKLISEEVRKAVRAELSTTESHSCKCSSTGEQKQPVKRDVYSAFSPEQQEEIKEASAKNEELTTPTISMEVIKEKVLETPKRKVQQQTQLAKPKKTVATSKGGTAFKIFEPVSLSSVTSNPSSENSVVLEDTEDEAMRKANVIRASLS